MDFIGTDIEDLTKQAIDKIKILRKRRKHLVLVIDEIDSFSNSNNQIVTSNEKAFKKFLKMLTNFSEPKKPSILPKASKTTISQTKSREESKKAPIKRKLNNDDFECW